MLRVPRNKLVYEFDASTPPVATIDPGEVVIIESHDTSTGRIHSLEDVDTYVQNRNPLEVNPAGGPIFINGAEPGDALAVKILSIELGEIGFVRKPVGVGALQSDIEPQPAVMVRAVGDNLIFGNKLRFKARPMVGVLGTAPAEGKVYTAHPGQQGSNMDFNAASPGSTVYLPVNVPGALFAAGDLHASMGDGEVSGTGIEISGDTMYRIDLLKKQHLKRPWIETESSWIGTGQGETLELAVEQAVDELTQILQRQFRLSRTEAFLLVSARGDVRIGQAARIAGCDATAYAVFDKHVIQIDS